MQTETLREKKYARTRLALASALETALEQFSFDAISVKSLCATAEVSEATFFNYFPNKTSLLEYVIQFWLLDLTATVQTGSSTAGISTIERLFALWAQQCRRRPGFMRALTGWLSAGGVISGERVPSVLERRLAFPDRVDLQRVEAVALDALLARQVEAAVRSGQLPENVLLPTLLVGLVAILLGVPLALLSSDPERIASMYQQQLQIFWSGVRLTAGGSGDP